MGSRLVLAMVAAVAIVAVGGIGFAAFTASVYVDGSGAAGSVALSFTSNPYGTAASSPAGATCAIQSYGGSTGTITVAASNLEPGQYCTFTLSVQNVGTLPITSETSTYAYVSGSVCNSGGQMNCIWVSDGIGLNTETGTSGSDSTTIPVSGEYTYILYVELPGGSTIQSTALSFTITLTGSAGT
jgi:hypothetical protein